MLSVTICFMFVMPVYAPLFTILILCVMYYADKSSVMYVQCYIKYQTSRCVNDLLISLYYSEIFTTVFCLY